MTAPRLAPSLEASAILRRTEAGGGFGAILRRGDPDRGALLVVVAHRGEHMTCLQRTLDWTSGDYRWGRTGPAQAAPASEIRDFLADQARFDPDLWQIEVDIADPERFIAETTASG